jgi:molybdopterin/thiamine biosynthesis adenylyltransferase
VTDFERNLYQWQLSVPGFGEAGQAKLKKSSVLISRVGGVGGAAAYQLAAAGVGRLVLAHAGNLRTDDLNRQILMRADAVGKLRVDCAAQTLLAFNPTIEVVPVPENISASNAARLVAQVDLVVDCAPLFEERYAMNREAVRQNRPMVECAMYELEAQLTAIRPRQSACLACVYPEAPPDWTRHFPVFGAVSGTIGSLAAMEAIKILAGFGSPLFDRLLCCDLRSMNFRTVNTRRLLSCPVCGTQV